METLLSSSFVFILGAEQCRRQKEPILCPLCRAPWSTSTISELNSVLMPADDNRNPSDASTSVPQVTSLTVPSCHHLTSSTPQQSTSTTSPSSSESPASPTVIPASGFEKQTCHGSTFVRSPNSQRPMSHVHLPCCHSVIGKEHTKMAAVWEEVS